MRPDSLVFDLDGTLWDTNATCAAAWNRVVGRLGIAYREITEADLRAVTGRPHLECVQRVFVGLSDAEHQRICADTQREDNLAIAQDGGALYPGVREHLPGLASHLPLYIVSNCQSGYIEAFLAWTGFAPHFGDFECWGRTGKSKAENLRDLVARNRLGRPVFVGDTQGDGDAARAVGVPFVHARYGFGSVRDCDHAIVEFAQLARLVRPR